MKQRVYNDPEQCRQLWEKNWPVKGLFDLWPVRCCFHEAYLNPLHFYTVEQGGRLKGLLPLSWCEESQQFVFFPGETWKGKTWLEQNRILSENPSALRALLQAVPGSLDLRYLLWNPMLGCIQQTQEDDIGYHFYPGKYNFSFENYWLEFSGKSRKKIRNEMNKLEKRNLKFRFNSSKDLEHMFEMNQSAFSDDSYFTDPRFYNAFDRLASFLSQMGLLRIITVLVDDKIAAVDMGGIFNNTYTLFAGGTNSDFPGIAKIINLHHMKWACEKRFDLVDFLCGNFNWKTRFHLSPRPLYEIAVHKTMSRLEYRSHEKEVLCA